MSLQKESEWEEQFEKRFRYFFHRPCERCSIVVEKETMRDRILWTDSLKQEVKDFIKELLAQREKEIAEEVEKLNMEIPNPIALDDGPYPNLNDAIENAIEYAEYEERERVVGKVLSILKH